MITLDDRILAVLREANEPLAARAVWERLGRPGAEGSVGGRLNLMHKMGRVLRLLQGDGNTNTPSLWRAA